MSLSLDLSSDALNNHWSSKAKAIDWRVLKAPLFFLAGGLSGLSGLSGLTGLAAIGCLGGR
jgi:hypothetical protein